MDDRLYFAIVGGAFAVAIVFFVNNHYLKGNTSCGLAWLQGCADAGLSKDLCDDIRARKKWRDAFTPF